MPTAASRLMLTVALLCAAALAQAPQPSRPLREMGLLPESKDPLGWQKPGDVPTLPEAGELVVQKVRPVDCRVVRGFVHSPVDGRPDSWGYNGVVNEYDNSQGGAGGHWQNICYEMVKDPGVHVTLADDAGFNALYLRGGFEGLICRDVDALDGPGAGKVIAEIPVNSQGEGGAFSHILAFNRVLFPEPVKARRISFFKRDNILSDAAFLRVGAAAVPRSYAGAVVFHIGQPAPDVSSLGPDFARLNTANPGEQHPSAFERRFPLADDRGVTLLASAGPGSQRALRPNQQVHFVTPPLPAGAHAGAARFDLDLRGAPPGSLLCLAVQDPLIGGHELLRVDVKTPKSGRVRCVLDFPDQWISEGQRFWFTVACQSAATLGPDSTISLLSVSPEAAMEEHLAWRLFLLKGYFYVLSEARPWSGRPMSAKWLADFDGKTWYVQRMRPQLMDLYRTVEHLHALAPDHPVVAQYYNWLTREGKPYLDPKDAPPVEEVPGAPRWAVLLNLATQKTMDIPAWWIENRLTPQGEMGGFLSDDTDMYGWWLPGVFLDSEGFAPKARNVFKAAAASVLQRNLRDGINIRAMDPLHAYEEGQNHMAFMPLVFYGDPRYVEWLMASARSVEKWMYRTPDGRLRFRVNTFGWDTAQKPPEKPAPQVSGESALLLHSHLTLAWYNRNPRAIQTIADFADPAAGNNLTHYGGPSASFAAYWLTGDAKYLGLPPPGGSERNGANWWGHMVPEFITHGKEAREQAWWKAYGLRIANEFLFGDGAWAAGQSRTVLCKSMEYALYGNPFAGGGVVKYRHIWTEAEMFTDRVFLPMQAIAQPMLGGYTVRNRTFPTYAVSYENLGKDFAALVLEQGRDRLKLVMVNLADKPRNGAFVVWQLDHGRYELTIGPDADDNGEMDSVETARTLELSRMDRVPVALPARKPVIFHLRQKERLDDLLARPDLAISEDDVVKEGGSLKVTVHNIGAAAAPNAVAAALDSEGKVLAQVPIPALEAPLDMVPRTLVVRLPSANASKVTLDPDGALREITRANNSVAVP